nr:AraC family transcriptional regulator [Cerasicoccus arenae]
MLTETPADPRVFKILEFLAQNISIQPIDYPALQSAVGLSRAQINRIFQKGAGLSPRQWMVARCLDEAQQQIRHGGHSFKEIAASLGFFDASHFTRWHRQQTGQSPSHWKIRQAF